MKATKSIKATDLNAKLADMTNQPKYFHVLSERYVCGMHSELGKIENLSRGTILEESYDPDRRDVYEVWVDTEQTVSTRDPQALVKVPGDKVVVFKKVITTTYEQV